VAVRRLDLLAAVLAVAGVTLVVFGGSPPSQSAEPASVQGPPAPAGTGVPRSNGRPAVAGPAPLGRSVPVRLDIPAIGVSTALIQLGLNRDGTIAVPPLKRGAPAGWYRYLPSPGEVGPAVILGHVDTAQDGPAVFYRLRQLHPGDTATVRRTDGSAAVFTVREVAEYPKTAFPSERVYGPLDHPALRLITCGGSFDALHREYRANVVVYATLTATQEAT
jgi:sortase (surface protein transpeptidase)